MIVSVFLLVEDGADRVYVSTREPSFKPSSGKPYRVFRADVELPDAIKVDGVIKVHEGGLGTIEEDLWSDERVENTYLRLLLERAVKDIEASGCDADWLAEAKKALDTGD